MLRLDSFFSFTFLDLGLEKSIRPHRHVHCPWHGTSGRVVVRPPRFFLWIVLVGGVFFFFVAVVDAGSTLDAWHVLHLDVSWMVAGTRIVSRFFFFRSHPSGTYRRGDQFFIVGTATCGECSASSCFGVADACLGMHVGSHEGRCHGRCSHVGSLVVDAAVVCRDVKCGASSTPIHPDCGHAAQNLPGGVFPPFPPPHTPHPFSSSTVDPVPSFPGWGVSVYHFPIFLLLFPWTKRTNPSIPGSVSGLPFLIRLPPPLGFLFFPPHVSRSRAEEGGGARGNGSHSSTHPWVPKRIRPWKKETKKERHGKKKNRKPSQEDGGTDGGTDGDTNGPADKPRHVPDDSSSSLVGHDRRVDGKPT